MSLPVLRSCLPVFVSIGLFACGGAVSGGGAGGTGGGDTTVATTTTTSGSSGQGGAANAIVVGLGTVTIRVSSEFLACSDPGKGPPFSECEWFTFEITMPESMLQVGTLDLASNSEVTVFAQEASAPYGADPNACGGSAAVSGGGKGGSWGILDITAVDPAGVSFTLSDTASGLDYDADGSYEAPRCY